MRFVSNFIHTVINLLVIVVENVYFHDISPFHPDKITYPAPVLPLPAISSTDTDIFPFNITGLNSRVAVPES